jgi:hypothetical protein
MPLWKKVKIVDPGKATMESTTRKEFTLFLAFAFTAHVCYHKHQDEQDHIAVGSHRQDLFEHFIVGDVSPRTDQVVVNEWLRWSDFLKETEDAQQKRYLHPLLHDGG